MCEHAGEQTLKHNRESRSDIDLVAIDVDEPIMLDFLGNSECIQEALRPLARLRVAVRMGGLTCDRLEGAEEDDAVGKETTVALRVEELVSLGEVCIVTHYLVSRLAFFFCSGGPSHARLKTDLGSCFEHWLEVLTTGTEENGSCDHLLCLADDCIDERACPHEGSLSV